MDWDKLRIFHAVAEAGSLTHAGETLGLSQSAVSRQISALEDSIKAPLFHRHARGLILTEQGEALFQTTRDIQGRVTLAEAMLSEATHAPRGEFRVTTTIGFGSTWLTPRLNEFIRSYPDIRLHLLLDDRELDLAMREADVAIRLRAPVQGDLIQRKLFNVHYHLYASRAYVEKHGAPASLAELDAHPIVTYGSAPPEIAQVNWLETIGRGPRSPRRPALTVNNIYGLVKAVESGIGIAALPDYMCADNSSLVRILEETEGPRFETYFVYPEEMRHSKRVALFRDFLLGEARKWAY
ncbi:MAG: LysR family transcriptional regulator [Alphaproteobacteria bacterium]